jgi:hypothetical protein
MFSGNLWSAGGPMSGRVKGVSGEVVDAPGFIGRLGLMGISLARSIHVDQARRGWMFGESTLRGAVHISMRQAKY